MSAKLQAENIEHAYIYITASLMIKSSIGMRLLRFDTMIRAGPEVEYLRQI